jgi:uncharacterized protein YkwD
MNAVAAPRRTWTTRLIAATLAATAMLALVQTPALAGMRGKMFDLTNRSRANHGKALLAIDSRLSKVAKKHSAQMAAAGELFHSDNLPGAIRARWTSWGENVGVTPTSLGDLQRAFMHSKVHKSNVLNEAFAKVGIGVVENGDGKMWVTVIFYG